MLELKSKTETLKKEEIYNGIKKEENVNGKISNSVIYFILF